MKFGDLRSACHEGDQRLVLGVLEQYEDSPYEALQYVKSVLGEIDLFNHWRYRHTAFESLYDAFCEAYNYRPGHGLQLDEYREIFGCVNIGGSFYELMMLAPPFRKHVMYVALHLERALLEESLTVFGWNLIEEVPR